VNSNGRIAPTNNAKSDAVGAIGRPQTSDTAIAAQDIGGSRWNIGKSRDPVASDGA
jgi:hypothetical protein